MTSFSKSSINLLICGTIMLLIACTSPIPSDNQPNLKDGGFLSGNPCDAPCFFNITPGLTTTTQAKEVIRALGIIQDCEEFDNTSESGSRGIICRPILILTFENDRDVVSGIGFHPSTNITVAEVIKKYGEPNAVLAVSSGLPESQMYTAMTLYFDDIRVDLTLPKQEGLTYKLEDSIVVENIGCSNQNSYQASRRYSSPWKGFVQYESFSP